jgi:AcrR family transcriptional regulator
MGPATTERAARRVGGRSARVRKAVLDSTAQTVAEQGAAAVSVAEIARRSGVHDTSIYRRWPTKEHLILDSLLNYSAAQLSIPDTGSLRDDLLAFAASVTTYAATPIGQALLKAMAVTDDDEAMAASRAEFWLFRLDQARTMIDRAVERGEVAADTDPALALELLISPLHFRLLLSRQQIDRHVVAQLVDILLKGLAG